MFSKLEILRLFFHKINNLGNFFKNVLRLVSAILGGPEGYSLPPYSKHGYSGVFLCGDRL